MEAELKKKKKKTMAAVTVWSYPTLEAVLKLFLCIDKLKSTLVKMKE